MPDWSAGYVADLAYTYGTYTELSPHRARLAFLMAGVVPPKVTTACELGFGQGMSINVHAAASDIEWHGTDFAPAQAAFAQDLAAASGAKAHLHDESFAEFCSRADLPDFDFIGLHGIFSWISDENRTILVDFIRRKLRVGGVLYISYNSEAGWAAMAPLRDLMSEYADVMGAPGSGVAARVDQSIGFVERLFASNPSYLKVNPHLATRFDKVKTQNRNYLAHEYFNRDWVPFTFSRIARWLEPAKVSYVCSAHYLDQIDAINLTADQRKLLEEIPDPVLQQTVRDFVTNQTFRRDYWVRGARRMSAIERDELLLQTRILLVTERADVALTAAGPLGEVTLQEQVYAPVLDYLADQQPHTIGELAKAVNARGVTPQQTIQAVLVLAGLGKVAALQSDDVIAAAAPHAQRLNLRLAELAVSNLEMQFVAAPATGSVLILDRLQLLFLLARARGQANPEDWGVFADSVLTLQGQRLNVDGKPMESAEEQRNELISRAVKFRDQKLPLLIKTGAVA